jgi:hypothetical protein
MSSGGQIVLNQISSISTRNFRLWLWLLIVLWTIHASYGRNQSFATWNVLLRFHKRCFIAIQSCVTHFFRRKKWKWRMGLRVEYIRTFLIRIGYNWDNWENGIPVCGANSLPSTGEVQTSGNGVEKWREYLPILQRLSSSSSTLWFCIDIVIFV